MREAVVVALQARVSGFREAVAILLRPLCRPRAPCLTRFAFETEPAVPLYIHLTGHHSSTHTRMFSNLGGHALDGLIVSAGWEKQTFFLTNEGWVSTACRCCLSGEEADRLHSRA